MRPRIRRTPSLGLKAVSPASKACWLCLWGGPSQGTLLPALYVLCTCAPTEHPQRAALARQGSWCQRDPSRGVYVLSCLGRMWGQEHLSKSLGLWASAASGGDGVSPLPGAAGRNKRGRMWSLQHQVSLTNCSRTIAAVASAVSGPWTSPPPLTC